jgi:glycosyltransferase involved in cell wall biosynthesis
MFAEAGHKVAYVNPVFTWLSFMEDRECRSIYWDGFHKRKEVSPGLWLETQLPLLPFRRKNETLNHIDMSISRRILGRLVHELWQDEEYLQIVYSPEDFLRLRPTPECRGVVYECVDEHAAYPWNQRRRGYIERLEGRLLDGSDLVVFTARGLADTKSSQCRRSVVIPNGVDLEKFRTTASGEVSRPEDLQQISSPIVMYVGAVMDWFDWSLLEACARMRPAWQFVLIGPTNLPSAILNACRNIHYLGTKSPNQVPVYLKFADVCLIPFKLNELTKNVSPLKLYEYLACGKPVVSVAMPEVVAAVAEGAVAIAADASGFISAIEGFLDHGCNKELCLSIAKDHSWPRLFVCLNQELDQARLISH